MNGQLAKIATALTLALGTAAPVVATTIVPASAEANWNFTRDFVFHGQSFHNMLSGIDTGLHTAVLPEASFLTESALAPTPFSRSSVSLIASPYDSEMVDAQNRLQYSFVFTANDQAEADVLAASLAANLSPLGFSIGTTAGARITGTGFYSAQSWGLGGAAIIVTGEPFNSETVFLDHADCRSDSAILCSGSFSFDLPVALYRSPFDPLSFTGYLAIYSGAYVDQSGFADAYIDPVITLFGVDPAKWTMALSLGVGNPGGNIAIVNGGGNPPPPDPGPGVPEPASWALLIAGFVMTGGAQRRAARRRSYLTAVTA
jgi:hypothetical protein